MSGPPARYFFSPSGGQTGAPGPSKITFQLPSFCFCQIDEKLPMCFPAGSSTGPVESPTSPAPLTTTRSGRHENGALCVLEEPRPRLDDLGLARERPVRRKEVGVFRDEGEELRLVPIRERFGKRRFGVLHRARGGNRIRGPGDGGGSNEEKGRQPECAHETSPYRAQSTASGARILPPKLRDG